MLPGLRSRWIAGDHVGVREDGRHLGGDGRRPGQREGTAGPDVRGQGYPVDQFHDEEQPLQRVVEHRVVHLRHARVLDPGGDPRLAPEPLGELLGELR